MPPFLNYRGEEEQFNRRLLYPNSMAHHGGYYGAPLALRGTDSDQFKISNIDILPDESLFEILRRLPGQERSICACVSKHWLTLLCSIRRTEMSVTTSATKHGEGRLSRSLEGKRATDVRLAAIAVGTASRGGLGRLFIRGSNSTRRLTNFGLSAVARGSPSLKSLSIWNVSTVGDEGLLEFAKECRMLKKLDLCICPSLTDKGIVAIAENCSALVDLSIESCPSIGNGGVQAIALGCPKLESISIIDCPLVGNEAILKILSSSSVLSKVKLQGVNISDFSLAAVGEYGKSVTSLTLSCLRNVSKNSLSDDGLLAFAKAAKSIESLNLEHCHKVTLSGVILFLSNCSSTLRSLSLVKCKGLKDDTIIEDIFQNCCTSLRRISIEKCPTFGSSSLKVLGSMCPNLRRVELTGLCGMTDDGIVDFLKFCHTGLVSLNLTGCVNLTDESVLVVVGLHSGTIKVLSLNGCRKITDKSVYAIAGSCRSLKDLDISNCAVTDSGVAALSSSHQLNLQILSVSGCSRISNKSVPFLIQLGKSLVGLNLKQCTCLSIDAVDVVVSQLWQCNILR